MCAKRLNEWSGLCPSLFMHVCSSCSQLDTTLTPFMFNQSCKCCSTIKPNLYEYDSYHIHTNAYSDLQYPIVDIFTMCIRHSFTHSLAQQTQMLVYILGCVFRDGKKKTYTILILFCYWLFRIREVLLFVYLFCL